MAANDSEVSVVATDGKWECVGCVMSSEPFSTRRDIYNHLIDHVAARHKVSRELLTRLAQEIGEEREAARPKWTEDEARDLLVKLSLYYDEPVKPISEYCRALRTWQRAIEDACEREPDQGLRESFRVMARDIRTVGLYVDKSNLLARLLYLGEELRPDPCPIHKGHWSGCVWGEGRCPHCMSGDNVTGWVAKP